MSKVQMVRALVNQRLTAAAEEIFGLFERTIAEYEEELCRSKEKNERQQKLLDAVLKPEVRLHRAVLPSDVQKVIVGEEGQQEWSPSLDQENPPEPPHIKEEQEELWISQEGEQLQGLEEADITKFLFTPVPVKSEDDEEKPQSSQLHQRQNEQMETAADGEDCVGPEPARTSHPDPELGPVTGDETEDTTEEDSCEPEDSDDEWKKTRKPKSGLKSLEKYKVSKSEMRSNAVDNPFNCSVCDKRFTRNEHLNRHMMLHTGERRFSCIVCGKRFARKDRFKEHMMMVHSVEKIFSGNFCKQITWPNQIRRHISVCHQSSQLHQNQTEVNRQAVSQTSSSTEPLNIQMKENQEELWTSQEGEQLQGLEEADITKFLFTPVPVNSENDEEKPQSSQLLTEQSDDLSNKTREPQSRLNFFTKNEAAKTGMTSCTAKPFCCLVCDNRFTSKTNLNRHMAIHTRAKPFCCSYCGLRFQQKVHMTRHMAVHTGEKRYSCSACDRRFSRSHHLRRHTRVCPQSSQLHQTEQNREAEPGASSSTEQMETGADGEDCGGPEPARTSHPDPELGPVTGDETEDTTEEDSCEPEDSDDEWKKTRKPKRGLKSLEKYKVSKSEMRSNAVDNPFNCSVCGKRFTRNFHLNRHMMLHTGERRFSCIVCGKRFARKDHFKEHMMVHSVEKIFSGNICDQRQTEQMEPGADGEDCDAQEPARNSHPDTELGPMTENN